MKKRLLYLIYSLLFFLPATVMAQTATHVVISEVYGGGGNSGSTILDDFIELYNPTSSPIDISGWSVQYAAAATATGAISATNQTIVPASTTIKAHGYYLIQESAGTSTTAVALSSPDLIGTIAISGTTGKVFLVNNSTLLAAPAGGSTVVDFVAWGPTATPYEGTGPAPVASNTTSIERKASATSTATTMAAGGSEDLMGNGYDSDNNANDFFVPTAVNPQSSQSPIEPAITVTPTLAATPGTISFGTTQVVNTTSASQSFSLSGTNIPATGVSLTVAAPFAISATSTGGFGTTLTFTQAQMAAAQTVYVQFTPTSTTAASGAVNINSTGAAQASVTLTGTGATSANPATITVTPSTLTFASQTVNTTSAAQFFNFSATSLSANVTATSTGPYLVSKDGLAFSSSVSYTTTEAAASPKVYVQFTPTTVAASIAGSVVVTTSNVVAAQTVTLSGTSAAAAAPPTGTASHVVISEVYGAGGNTGAAYLNDYVELYNPTTSDVLMTGWSLQYQSAAGVSTYSGLCPLPDGATIKAHGYYLVQLASGGTVGVALPVTPDFIPLATNTTQSFNMSGASGKVALCNTVTNLAGTPASTAATPPTLLVTTSIVDFVAYGTVNYASGFTLFNPAVPATASATIGAPGLTATTSIERKALSTSTAATMAAGGTDDLKGNGYDTDTDPTDFFVASTLNPQNSASTIEPALTPAYVATPNALTFNQNINTTSAGTPFVLTGSGTLPATSVGTTAPYMVSKTATGGYNTAISFTATEMAANPTVYVQFAPTALGAANGVINITGVGAGPVTVALTGTGTAVPVATLTANPTTLPFPSTTVGVTSAALTYTLSGTNITAATQITASGPYTVSTDNVTFSTSASFAATALNASQTPNVYVKFTPTAVGANAGTVVQTTNGGGTATATVTLSGTGVAPPNTPPTLAAIPDLVTCAITSGQSIALTGITVGTETTTQAISSISVTTSNSALFSTLGVTPVIAGASTLNFNIAAGASGTGTVTVTVKDNGGTANGGVDTYSRTFNVTVSALAAITITSDIGTLVEKGATATLTASGGTAYTWTTATSITSASLTSASITVRPSATTTYTVTSTNACGSVSTQTITITTRNASRLETSNVITPNGDGKNDYFVIRNIDLYPVNTVKVFDKAGKLIFVKSGYNNDWNGYYNGSPLAQGTYYYVVDLGTGLPYRGVISVVRD